jgi:hypothetical protein
LPKNPAGGVHLQASPLLLVGVIGGIISTVAIVISGILASQPIPGPGPGGGNGPLPPPPPNTALVVLIISAAFFVTSWATVAVAIARDQILQRQATATSPSEILTELHVWMDEMRVEAATDRANQMKDLMAQLDTFADQHETEGYLNAMRAAGATTTNSDVRFLRKVPPPDA